MYHGQEMQDKYLNESIFKNYKNGFYIDIGAHDGINKSNTYYFYKNGWRGINIEPIPKVFRKLFVNKPRDINLNLAVSDKNGYADFTINEGYTEMLSGLKDNYDPNHINRIDREIKNHGGESKTIKVNTKRLETILEQNNIKIPVFEAVVKKSVLLNDQSKDLIIQENQVVSVDGVNGDALKVGSMDEVNTNGNWPKTYGDNE